jgi:hypothetical protein
LNLSGIIRLSNALTRVEERLSKVVHDCPGIDNSNITYNQQEVIIPLHNNWIVME